MALLKSFNELNINIDGMKLQNQDQFNHLETTIDRKYRGEAEIEQRITKTLKLYQEWREHILYRKQISVAAKL